MVDAHASVIIASCNRRDSLTRLLKALEEQDLPNETALEIIVADNGSSDGSSVVLSNWQSANRFIPLILPFKGKARALNSAVSCATGDLLVFTDDDVIPSRTWLQDLLQARRDQPSAVLFAGPIEPVYPASAPEWLRRHPISKSLFAAYEPSTESRFINPLHTPHGPNFAVPRAIGCSVSFREDLGPSAANGPLSHDDSDYVSEIRLRHSAFAHQGGVYYVSSARVLHEVREEQLLPTWIVNRLFYNGRSVAARFGRIVPYSSSSLLEQVTSRRSSLEDSLDLAAEVNYYLGQLDFAQGILKGAKELRTYLSRYDWYLLRPICSPLATGLIGELESHRSDGVLTGPAPGC